MIRVVLYTYTSIGPILICSVILEVRESKKEWTLLFTKQLLSYRFEYAYCF